MPDVLKVEAVVPHQQVRDQGKIAPYVASLGDAVFLSHQWLSRPHPDRDLRQFGVLQQALRQRRPVGLDVGLDLTVPAERVLFGAVQRDMLMMVPVPEVEHHFRHFLRRCNSLSEIGGGPALRLALCFAEEARRAGAARH